MRDPEYSPREKAGAPERLYTIGEAAGALGISLPTLRLYEREGLLIPIRKPSGHRLYTEGDLERVRCIRKTINEDKVSIAGMRRLLAVLPCWKVKGCPEEIRNSCPGFHTPETPCWIVTPRLWKCATAQCRSCPVYLNADCHKIKSTVSSLMLEQAPES
jgi:MerR family transcriptional regulator/heat shock protein HspR